MARDFPYSKDEVVNKIFDAGVVGAGGAGFPTHVKAGARADIVIANGCECEPLIQSDRHVLGACADEVLDGLLIMMLATGAGKGYVALREGMPEAQETLEKKARGIAGVEVTTVVNTYPAGDEHILVYEITGRAIPQGGIPPDVGVVVSNVNTLVNVRRALAGEPVTTRVVSVCGDTQNPCIVEVPIGVTVGDLLRITGNDSGLDRKGILLSGVMMGEFCTDLKRPLDKRMGAVVVLPSDNQVIIRKSMPIETIVRRAASVCCQCTLCTELCPRHLMGHAISPHKVMRAICWDRSFVPDLGGALFCSGCGLCGVYVCPMLLSPDRISYIVRAEMAGRKVTAERAASTRVEPVRPHRLIPHQRIVERTGLAPYERELKFMGAVEAERVTIPMAQHFGVPARPVVAVGERVRRGQLIGDVKEGEIGARVHASIDGVVVSVNQSIVVEKK
ncbi:MAG: 4Fe-4S dicluster domain-containing protein [Candidatus Eisenbacteria bacterium]